MTSIPLLADGRVVVAEPGEDDLVLRAPAERDALQDVAQAVRDALAYPLEARPLEQLVRRGSTATIVIEQPSLPIPSIAVGPRHTAVAAVADELERLGVRQTTILVAGGLLRRTTPRDIGLLVPPEFRRRFKGRVIVHDAEAEDLVELGRTGNVALRVNRALVETDLVVTVTAAETVLHGGPAALLAASGRESLRAAGALSLLETNASQGWRLAVELERLLAARVPVLGVSIALNAPRFTLSEPRFSRLTRTRVEARGQTASAVFAGAPSTAHTEALLRSTVFKGVELAEPVDAVVIGIPPTTPWTPRERPNPVTAAYLGLGLALRLWRNMPPVAADGTAILVHPFQRRFARPTQDPYRALFYDARTAQDIGAMRDAERAAVQDAAAIASYRAGRACHPLQPFVEWSACDAAAHRLGAVVIAGCRDAHAARQLGFVPAHGLGAALEMARGRGATRTAYLVVPPYFPLLVGT